MGYSLTMASKKEVENLTLRSSSDLCKLAEMLGYKRPYGQLRCSNGAFVSSLLDFFDDNPGAMEAVSEWVMENHDLEEEVQEGGDEGTVAALKLPVRALVPEHLRELAEVRGGAEGEVFDFLFACHG
jgi:hypothetical protein